MKKICLLIMLIVMMGALTGCTRYMYKKGDVVINMDENGKGYIEQSFAVKNELLFMTESKLESVAALTKLSYDMMNNDLGVDVDYNLVGGKEVMATLRLEFDSYNDFNKKVNAIIDEVNLTKSNYKIYDFTYGARGIDMDAVVAAHVNKLFDKYNIKYDMTSFEYRYMIEKMMEDCEFNPNVSPETVPESIEAEIKIHDLEYFYCEGNDTYKKSNTYIKEGENPLVAGLAMEILDIYIKDVIATNVEKIIDVEAINERIYRELIEDYSNKVCRNINDDFIKKNFVNATITDISQLSNKQIEEMDLSTGVPLYAYGYREGLLDGYVYTLSELSNKIFDDDYYTSHWEARVMVNGKEVDYHGDFYSWGSYGVKNQNNDDKVNKATLDEDETPKTFDKFPLLLGFVVIISATVTCVVLYSIKRRYR